MFRQLLTEGSRKIDVLNKEHDQMLNDKLDISNQLIFFPKHSIKKQLQSTGSLGQPQLGGHMLSVSTEPHVREPPLSVLSEYSISL